MINPSSIFKGTGLSFNLSAELEKRREEKRREEKRREEKRREEKRREEKRKSWRSCRSVMMQRARISAFKREGIPP
jgi:hypothetical protein